MARAAGRRWTTRLLAGVLAAGMAFGGVATHDVFARGGPRVAERKPEPRDSRIVRRQRIARACKWLASRQNDDGSFGQESRVIIATTSMGLLALMASGSSDGRGPYGGHIRRGINYLLRLIDEKADESDWPPGYFETAGDTTSRMHGQGFATLALATALGTSTPTGRVASSNRGARQRRIRKVLKLAVDCCIEGQTPTGGYGYRPTADADHEGSVTVAIAQALRAARDVGIVVPVSVVENGLRYLRNSQKEDGSFKYSTRQDTSTYELTAAALSTFFLFGRYEDDADTRISDAIRAMRRFIDQTGPDRRWYYYGHFYGAWACWQKDGTDWHPTRSLWGWWQERVYPHLYDRQTSVGSFDPKPGRYTNYGPELSTAFAILTMAIPDEALPIFQR